MTAKQNAIDVGLSIVAELAQEIPGFGGLLRLHDKWATDERIGQLEEKVAGILAVIGRDGQPLAVHIGQAVKDTLLSEGPDTLQLRKTDSCLVVMRALSQRSQLALDWDPSLGRDDARALVRGLLNHPDPVSELRAVVYELKRADLILVMNHSNAPEDLPWESIGPAVQFFPRTDRIFQPWDPRRDAVTICSHPSTKERRAFNASDLDGELGWGPRRFNPAAVYAQLRGWITVPYQIAHDPKYVLPWAFLSEEGEFFLDE